MHVRGGLLGILLGCSCIAACVADEATYPYSLLRVVDGDTVQVDAPFLPEPLHKTLYLRLEGIDTPERGQKAGCALESRRAERAKEFVEEKIRLANDIEIKVSKWDKYGGRVVGNIYLDGKSLSEILIKETYAIPYDGGEKLYNWCGPS